ncbi:MAG: hypothetical protein L3J33_05990 [Rhodobacteraceae bacterium]|nr:hypothetical protein [Paracoccaceae bacterium]
MQFWPKKHKPQYAANETATNGVLLLGDSHCRSFFNHPLLGPFVDGNGVERKLYCHKIRGASMTGFGRRKSSLALRSTTHRLVKKYRNYCSHTVYAFGQVDVELGLYYRWLQNTETFDPHILFEEIIDKYLQTILSFRTKTTPIIKGINQTVLESHKTSVHYVSQILSKSDTTKTNSPELQKLLEIYPSYAARKTISDDFNHMLKAKSEQNGIRYFDLNSQLVDPKTNSVYYAYRPAGTGHHVVDSMKIRQIYKQGLAQALFN